MRVTPHSVVTNTLAGLNRNLAAVSKTQAQLTSGRNFDMASENPVGASASMRLRSETTAATQYDLFRLYREERLGVRKRGGRKRALGTRSPMALPEAANQRWSLDFVSDALSSGRRFRVLVVVDDFTRECLSLVVDTPSIRRRSSEKRASPLPRTPTTRTVQRSPMRSRMRRVGQSAR